MKPFMVLCVLALCSGALADIGLDLRNANGYNYEAPPNPMYLPPNQLKDDFVCPEPPAPPPCPAPPPPPKCPSPPPPPPCPACPPPPPPVVCPAPPPAPKCQCDAPKNEYLPPPPQNDYLPPNRRLRKRL